MRYLDLNKIDCGVRCYFYDDIIVIVVFFDLNLVSGVVIIVFKGLYVFIRGGGMIIFLNIYM